MITSAAQLPTREIKWTIWSKMASLLRYSGWGEDARPQPPLRLRPAAAGSEYLEPHTRIYRKARLMETDRDRVVASARAVLPATERRRTDMTTRGFTFVADEPHNGAQSRH